MSEHEPSNRQQIDRDIARYFVSQVAPEEVDIFDNLVDNPPPDQSDAKIPDSPLGSGFTESLTVISPLALTMVSAVVTHILTEAITTTKDEAAIVVKRKIKDLFVSPTRLKPEQLKRIKKVAVEQAVKYGLTADEAEKMADSLIGVLATFPEREKNDGGTETN